MIEPVVEEKHLTRIGVFGVGGAGNNAVNRMVEAELSGVELFAVNTDLQALRMSVAPNKIQIGAQLTGGLGSGGDPRVGRQAADESVELLRENLAGFDMVFVAAGEGGGTGTGAAPVIAQQARASGALVVAVVTKPFIFEGPVREGKARDGITALRPHVDTLIVMPNDKLLSVHGSLPVGKAFRTADEVLLNAVRGISDIVIGRQMINIDFADVRTVMSERGGAVMTVGTADGTGRAEDSAHKALESPLIDAFEIHSARKILLNITGDDSMTLDEVNKAASVVFHATNGQADVRLGAARDGGLRGTMKVTLIATGLNEPLPKLEDVVDMLKDNEMFPVSRRRIGDDGSLRIDSGDLEVPTFVRRQMD
ncbi:MAG: cell division protein FtsZ [bacterium]|jgi:cell division protein FtsZ